MLFSIIFLKENLDPRTHNRVDVTMSKDSFVLIQGACYLGPNMSDVGLEKCLGVQRKNPASWRIDDRKSLGSMNFLISQPGRGVITEY